MNERIEIREGKEYRVIVLPEAKPPKNRSTKTHWHHHNKGWRCYICGKTRTDKPARSGPHWKLCKDCLRESEQALKRESALDSEWRQRAEGDK
jgi:hypothetical protein